MDDEEMEELETELESAVTVGDLIAQLQRLDPKLPVMRKRETNDHWESVVLEAAKGATEEEVSYSAYHSRAEVNDGDWYEKGETPLRAAVIG